MSHFEKFRDAMRASGLEPPSEIIADGKVHRFASNGKRGDDAGWYVLHDDGIAAGSFGDWRTGIKENWRADIGRGLSPAEESAHRAQVEAMRRERQAEEIKRKAEADAVIELATQAGLKNPHVLADHEGLPRVLVADVE